MDYFDDKSKVVCDKNCDNGLKVPPAQQNLTKIEITSWLVSAYNFYSRVVKDW